MRRGKLLFAFIIWILIGCFSLAWGADRGPIRSGETKSGFQLAGPSFIDTWTFNGNAGDRVLISAEPTSGSTAVYISLYPPDSGPREALGHQYIDYQLKQTGLYTMVIEESGLDAESTYDLTLLKIPGAIFSPGDPDGGAIDPGETLSPAGELSVSDLDAFQFYGNAGDRVLISAEPTSGSTAVYISLYPPDSGPREALGHQYIDYQLKQTGLYTMVIEESGRDAESTYDLSLLKIPGAISSPGDPDGGAIASGETLSPAGELSVSDLDAFQFYGDAGDRVLISAEPTSGSTAVYISLYPPDSGPREALGHQYIDYQLKQTGLYTMVIEESGRDAESTYDLSLLKIPGAISSPGDPDGGAIASGETLSPAGELSVSDLDAFQFYGDAGDRVLISAEPTSGSTAVYISLYPPDSGPREALGHQYIDYQLKQTGLYTMVIEESGRDAESTYDLSLLKIPGAISSPGDPDGGAIDPGERLSPAGELSVSDLDAFQFYGDAGDRVLISAEPTSGSTAVYISLYPPDSGPREALGHQYIDYQLKQTGLYTMVIEESGRDAESTYDLSLNKIPSTLRPGIYSPHPSNGAIISDLSDFFTWEPVSGATGYDLYFGENVIVPLTKIHNNLPSPSTSFPAMDSDKVYYWHVVAHTPGGDIQGPYWWFETTSMPLLYTPVTPCKIVDTRNTSGGIIGAFTQRNFRVFGDRGTIGAQGGDPAGCPSPLGRPRAVHINMAAVDPTGKGNLQAFPVGAGPGAGLSVSYNTIDTNLANAGTIKTSGPDITVASRFSSAHTVISVLGYYYENGDLLYTPVTPCKIVDTRDTPAGIIDAFTERDFHVFGDVGDQGGDSAGCDSPLGEPLAAHINMAAVDPTGKGNLQAFPVGEGPGAGLSVSYNTIDTNLANAGTIKTSGKPGPDITVASRFSSAHTVISVLGYYYENGDLLYTPVTPCKIADTRNTLAGIIDAGTQRNFRVHGPVGDQGGDPDGCPSSLGVPLAAHINMAAVDPTGKGNLQAFPVGAGPGAGLSVSYNTIDTNLANAGTVKTSGSYITVASRFSSAHTVISVLGYYYAEP